MLRAEGCRSNISASEFLVVTLLPAIAQYTVTVSPGLPEAPVTMMSELYSISLLNSGEWVYGNMVL